MTDTASRSLSAEQVEMRCTASYRRLFGVLQFSEENIPDPSAIIIEFACAECRKALQSRYEDLIRVVHGFDLTGRLVETTGIRSTGCTFAIRKD